MERPVSPLPSSFTLPFAGAGLLCTLRNRPGVCRRHRSSAVLHRSRVALIIALAAHQPARRVPEICGVQRYGLVLPSLWKRAELVQKMAAEEGSAQCPVPASIFASSSTPIWRSSMLLRTSRSLIIDELAESTRQSESEKTGYCASKLHSTSSELHVHTVGGDLLQPIAIASSSVFVDCRRRRSSSVAFTTSQAPEGKPFHPAHVVAHDAVPDFIRPLEVSTFTFAGGNLGAGRVNEIGLAPVSEFFTDVSVKVSPSPYVRHARGFL
jgi:hypothetical protein